MHRIDVPSATPEHLFTEGSPTGGVPATVVSDDWLNDLQENVAQAIEQSGIALIKGDYNQLYQAIAKVAMASFTKRNFTANDFIRIPDVDGGLIIRWGNGQSSPTDYLNTLPAPFPNAFLWLQVSHSSNLATGGPQPISHNIVDLGHFTATGTTPTAFISYLAIGR